MEYNRGSYKFTTSDEVRTKNRKEYWFSKTELKNLGVGLLIIILIPLVWMQRYLANSPLVTLGAITIFATAFILHELAHKFVAQNLGYWAEFRINQFGLIITLMSFFSPFKIIAPGAVMIAGTMRWDDYGKIATAGPATNIAQALFWLVISLVSLNPLIRLMGYIGMTVNSSLSLFNLIPFGVFDGVKIIRWDWKIWITCMLAAGGIYLYSAL
jgi:Zn-dependent protease